MNSSGDRVDQEEFFGLYLLGIERKPVIEHLETQLIYTAALMYTYIHEIIFIVGY